MTSVSVEESDVTGLLNSIRNGTATPLGGRSWSASIYTLFWDIKDMLKGMWQTQPVLLFVMGSLILLLVGVLLFVLCSSWDEETEPVLSKVDERPPISVEMPPPESIEEENESDMEEETGMKETKNTSQATKSGKQKED